MNGSVAVSLFCDIILLNTVDMHMERNASLEGVYFTHIIGHAHTHKPVSCQSVRFNHQFMPEKEQYLSFFSHTTYNTTM